MCIRDRIRPSAANLAATGVAGSPVSTGVTVIPEMSTVIAADAGTAGPAAAYTSEAATTEIYTE